MEALLLVLHFGLFVQALKLDITLNEKSVFIAGSDTDAGKTFITGLLARELNSKGHRVITQKWVHSGTKISDISLPEDLKEHDRLAQYSEAQQRFNQDYLAARCPYRFNHPSSGHLAAALENREIKSEKIYNDLARLENNFDHVLIEGIGGLLAPFSQKATLCDLIQEKKLPVILVVANRLGAINHTLLTLEVLKSRKISCLGCIWTCTQPGGDPIIQKDNPKIVSQLSGIKTLATLTYLKK